MNVVSKTFAAELHNLSVFHRELAGSTWPTVCAAVVLFGALSIAIFVCSYLAGGTCY